ncbi:MAG: hypothetical protein V3U93_02125 [Alphaproteobacteria bacterium]
MIIDIAAASAAGSRGGTMMPSRPSRTTSRQPGESPTITGRPAAIASTMAMPKVSISEGKTNASAAQ